MKRKNRILPILFLTLALLRSISGPQPLDAQTCFRGKRIDSCRSFFITEFGYASRLDPSPDPSKHNFLYMWEFGLMVNRNESSAVGGTLYFGADDNGTRLAIRARWRRWLGSAGSLEVAPGILVAGSDNHFDLKLPGFSGEVALNVADVFRWFLMVEVIKMEPLQYFPSIEPVGTDVAWYSGIKLGSYAGLVAAIAVPIAAGIALSASDW